MASKWEFDGDTESSLQKWSAPSEDRTDDTRDASSATKLHLWGRNLRGILAQVLDCNIAVSVFEHQSRYHIHFRAKTPGKAINSLLPQLWIK